MPTVSRSSIARPAPLACTQCRQKHVRCDGQVPICGRCSRERGVSCTYVASRRGRVRRTRKRAHETTPSSIANEQLSQPTETTVLMEPGSIQDSHLSATIDISRVSPRANLQLTLQHSPLRQGLCQSHSTGGRVDDLVTSYYTNFHSQHPVLVPRARFHAQNYPECVTRSVRLIGQLFSSTMPSSEAIVAAAQSLLTSSSPRDVSQVQSLVMYAIVLHLMHCPTTAKMCIARAAEITIELGSHREEFIMSVALCDMDVQESLRRTFWELYWLDIFLAALHRQATCFCDAIHDFPLLPGSSPLFGVVSKPCPLEAVESRHFAIGPITTPYSSFVPRTEAARLLRRVMRLSHDDDDDALDGTSVDAIDSAIAAWKCHWPQGARDSLDNGYDGADPVGIEALFTVQCAIILLHFPRSDFPRLIPSSTNIASANQSDTLPPLGRQHAIRAIAASREICRMASMPWPVETHSPLFVCAMVLACVVQLAAATAQLQRSSRARIDHHRDHVVLLLSLLQRLGNRWEVARQAVLHLRRIANTVFTPVNPPTDAPPSPPPSHDIFEDTTWFELFTDYLAQTNVMDMNSEAEI